jgi:hypothetical protein
MTPDKQNLSTWENLRPVDQNFLKPITGKSYKGHSPNPTYIIQKITEVLGPIGQKWGFTVVRETVHKGQPHQIEVFREKTLSDPDAEGKQHTVHFKQQFELVFELYHQVEVSFWQLDANGNRQSFSSFGGTPMLYLTSKGKWMMDEDAAKKSLTDAYVKGASFLGCAADLFLGIFDDKYSGPPPTGTDPESASDESAQPPAGKQTSTNPF